MIESEFNKEKLYNSVVHFYIDKKGYSKEQANLIAQRVVKREVERRICANTECGHLITDHIKNTDMCLILTCYCAKFKQSDAIRGGGATKDNRAADNKAAPG